MSSTNVDNKFADALDAFVAEYSNRSLSPSQWSDIMLMHITGGIAGDGGNVEEIAFLESMRGTIERRLLEIRGPRSAGSILQ